MRNEAALKKAWGHLDITCEKLGITAVLERLYHIVFPFIVPRLGAVAIEINSFCNRKCPLCPNSGYDRERVSLERRLFYKIIADLKEMRFRGAITFNLFNEPLLDPRLPEFIRHVRKELPRAFIYLNTNGDRLDIPVWKELRAAGLDWANVTQYDGKINDNVRALLNGLTEAERSHIDAHLLVNVWNRGGLVRHDNVRDVYPHKWCRLPFSQLCINYLGKAVLCCNDYFGEVELGDVRETKISGIWKGKMLREYRKRLGLSGRKGLTLCDRCDL